MFKGKENAKDCSDLYKRHRITKSGVYDIDPDGRGEFKVLCDMATSGGGWTVFQRRLDGSLDFFQGRNNYKVGFGDLTGEFWLGLEMLYSLTSKKYYIFRFDLENANGETTYAEYDHFAVERESLKFRLKIGNYLGLLLLIPKTQFPHKSIFLVDFNPKIFS